ncbi:hypothetical protein BCR34DRAFT_19315 [Clohesyomyces aquaticus]|uniref:Leucine-rich repeat domain-containing protein n=1 Tax=Clohesyomyces aquaticus TaxID=1231657 RepID=A0A1Y1ZB47_9PLEO|nr:hypothetical protein BCR34DRAFT_19315 [Clohesyomyces aquaticus]
MRSGVSNIEHLSFKRSMIESKVLAAFIRFPRTLKSFKYQRNSWGEEEDAPQDYSLLTSALSLHRNSLETLKFSDDWQEGEVVSTMGSLAEFEQLKIIHLPLSAMLPKSSVKASLRDLVAVLDLLPRVLEEFQSSVMPYLYGERQSAHWEDLVPMLEIIAEHANERFPRLRDISVGRSHFYKDAQPDWDVLEGICSMRGITLSVPRRQDMHIVQIPRHNEPVDDDSDRGSVEEVEIPEYFEELRLENTWDVLALAEENGGEDISTVLGDQLE